MLLDQCHIPNTCKIMFPTISPEIQDLSEGCDDLVPDYRIENVEISSEMGADNCKVIGIIVNFRP